MSTRRASWLAALLVALPAVAAACEQPSDAREAALDDWAAVETEAEGQTVRWWMFGGDERVNRYID